jgi:hypothetical protein
MDNYRCSVIRDGREIYVLRSDLTADELALVEEREKSSLARGRFGVLLRRLRETPLKAGTDAKLVRRRE